MTAMQTVGGVQGKLGVMIRRYAVARKCEIVIFIHKTDIDAGRTGLTVVAIDAGSRNGICRKRADY